MPSPNPCALLTGAVKEKCEKAQQDAQNPGGVLDSLVGSPGSEWWRHAVLRVAEVIIGTAMIIAGVRALTKGSDTVNVLVQGGKAVKRNVGKKL